MDCLSEKQLIYLMKIRIIQEATKAVMLYLADQSGYVACQLITHIGASNHLITESSAQMTKNVL